MKDVLITINRSEIDISTFLKAQIFDIFDFGIFVYKQKQANHPFSFLFFWCLSSLSSSCSAHFISKCHSGFGILLYEKWSSTSFFQRCILCYQEIRKRRWSSPERTILLWASVPELQSSREPHNTQSGGEIIFFYSAMEMKQTSHRQGSGTVDLKPMTAEA